MKMPASPHFPRMMFHRTKDPVTVYSQEELDGLGSEWSMKIFSGEDPPAAPPEPVHRPEPEEEREDEPSAEEEPPAEPRAKPAAHKTPIHPPPKPKGRQRGR